MLIDSFLLDITKYNSKTAYPFENGASDHDVKIVIQDNLNISLHKTAPEKEVQLIIDQTINYIQSMLGEETWDMVYNTNNVNKIFSNVQCILFKKL